MLIKICVVDRKWGKINHIVNNAGFTYDKMLHTMPDDAYDIIMKVHVRAPFRLVRAAAPYFRLKVCITLSFGVPVSNKRQLYRTA